MSTFYKFIRFSIVGISNTIISILVYDLLVYLGGQFIVSNIVSFMIGILNSYFWNTRWVFKINESKNSGIIFKFITVNLVVLAINSICLFLLVNRLFLNVYIAQIIVTMFCVAINFLLNKNWTFVGGE